MTICIIPARGGSKRIPRKNIKPFFGVPIIAWSIRVAQQASCFDRIIVSTDDTEIAEVALEFGAEVPFIRPEAISDDHAGTTEVIAHAVDHAELRLADDDSVCCVYPTAPLIHYEDLRNAARGRLGVCISDLRFRRPRAAGFLHDRSRRFGNAVSRYFCNPKPRPCPGLF